VTPQRGQQIGKPSGQSCIRFGELRRKRNNKIRRQHGNESTPGGKKRGRGSPDSVRNAIPYRSSERIDYLGRGKNSERSRKKGKNVKGT